ncbi:LOW QUALITY PROTEIN: hypothetical protein Cgig2_007626 [Carnegiea gigantea]|uniref:Uncharacterized protein n=1 Tax=Carnegiea gigantea TaxID=171969 RepID=A0A9Q1GQ84_9CARY|nr:LOW QUALITY PROTEIN: hypothetical protein Cgig2_007626 [Carnegiea gigantea]
MASPGCPSVLYFFRASKLTTSLFPWGTREGTCEKKLSLYTPTETKRGVTSRIPYLLGLLSNKVMPLLIPPAFGVDRHLFGSGISSLEDRQPCPCLICIKQIRSQTWKQQAVLCSLAVGSPKGFCTGFPLFQSGMSPQSDALHRKRKSYFQCFTFDFFLIAVMKPGLLLKQYRPKSLVSLGTL